MQKGIFVLLLVVVQSIAFGQDIQMEAGFGIGNVIGHQNRLGKGELHFAVIKSLSSGQIGIDFASGGNLIPGTNDLVAMNTEVLSPYDSKFGSICIVYRYAIGDHLFLEPRLGYSSLYAFVHTDNRTKNTAHNFTMGLALGANLNRVTLMLRTQYFGKTAEFEDDRGSTKVMLNSEPLSLAFLRLSYRFPLKRGDKD